MSKKEKIIGIDLGQSFKKTLMKAQKSKIFGSQKPCCFCGTSAACACFASLAPQKEVY